jgi:phosphate starvation-inducible protein PhoH
MKLGTLRQLRNNPFKVWYLDDNSQRQSFEPTDPKLAHALFGQQNRHLKQIERLTGVRVSSKGTTALLEGEGESLARAVRLLEELTCLLEKGFSLRPPDIE